MQCTGSFQEKLCQISIWNYLKRISKKKPQAGPFAAEGRVDCTGPTGSRGARLLGSRGPGARRDTRVRRPLGVQGSRYLWGARGPRVSEVLGCRAPGAWWGVLGLRIPKARDSWGTHLGLALGSPIFPSGCEGKLGVALESLQGRRDLT